MPMTTRNGSAEVDVTESGGWSRRRTDNRSISPLLRFRFPPLRFPLLFLSLLFPLLFVPTGLCRAADPTPVEPAPLAPPATNPAIRLVIELTDGSSLVGTPVAHAIGLTTPYAKANIPLERIRSLAMRDDRETATIRLQNNDILTGALGGEPLRMLTLFGEVSVGVNIVRGIRVERAIPFSADMLKGLILHLAADGTSKDSSGRDHNASTRGLAYEEDRHGHAQGAFSLGDSALKVPHHSDFDTDEGFTLSLWLKVKSWLDRSGRVENGMILGQWYSGPVRGDYLLGFDPRTGQVGMTVAHADAGFVSDMCLSEHPVPVGRWTHVAATFDKGEMRLFIDGRLSVEKKSTTVTHTDRGEYQQKHLHLGGLWNNQYMLDGVFDDVMIFSRPLSPEDVSALYQHQR